MASRTATRLVPGRFPHQPPFAVIRDRHISEEEQGDTFPCWLCDQGFIPGAIAATVCHDDMRGGEVCPACMALDTKAWEATLYRESKHLAADALASIGARHFDDADAYLEASSLRIQALVGGVQVDHAVTLRIAIGLPLVSV